MRSEILTAIAEMPDTMRKLGPVQLCTWLGLFCMWLYFPVAVAHNIFGANDTTLTAIPGGRGVGRQLFRGLLASSASCSRLRCRVWRENWDASIRIRFVC